MTKNKIPKNTNSRNIFRFLQKNYDEAFQLLVSARNYFTTNSKFDKQHLSKDQRLIYTLTMSTITTQLTSIMAWLLLYKAVENGEVSAKEIESEEFSMPEFNLGINDVDSNFAILPKPAKEILEKSCSLYNRMKRIEESTREQLLETVQ